MVGRKKYLELIFWLTVFYPTNAFRDTKYDYAQMNKFGDDHLSTMKIVEITLPNPVSLHLRSTITCY